MRVLESADGWDAPPTAPWLATALDHASTETFGRSYGAIGLGGSIPFMAMLGARFPEVQFVVTGVLGPDSNAHGPNEYLHLPTARNVTRGRRPPARGPHADRVSSQEAGVMMPKPRP